MRFHRWPRPTAYQETPRKREIAPNIGPGTDADPVPDTTIIVVLIYATGIPI
ncbi:hypothetical protein BJ928_107111 [Rhizobium sp. WW_1]|jgi:hypothetical protein|nr:hypothetical protein BJ928_107111 [Rhizobium sp. WW_1]